MIQMLNGIPGMENSQGMELKFERVNIHVSSAGQKVEFSKTTDSSTRKIVGVAINSTDDDATDASLLNLNIGAKEIFPRDFEAKMLRTGQEVPPNQRYFVFHKSIDVNRDDIRGYYEDGNAFTEAYDVSIYFLSFEE